MQSFMSALPDNERKTYQKISLISSMNNSIFTLKHNPGSKSSKIPSSLTSEDLINICKYSNPLIAPISPAVQQKINHIKFGTQQNTCLHIAAEFGNIHLVKHLVRGYNKIEGSTIEPEDLKPTQIQGTKQINQRNQNLDTPLMHCLRNNSEHKMEKVVSYLSKYSDLTLRDKLNRLCFEITLPAYNVSKVRILEFIKEKYHFSL